MTQAELLRHLQNYVFTLNRLAEARERLESKTYKLTPAYANVGATGGTEAHSKVEDYVEKTEKLKRTIANCMASTDIVKEALECHALTEAERDVLYCITRHEKLSGYAASKGIYISYVYKIRDRALMKVLAMYNTNRGKYEVNN